MQRGRLKGVRPIPQDVVHCLRRGARRSTCGERAQGRCADLAADHEEVRLLHLCQHKLGAVGRQ
jgi:hypothetical protein